MSTIKSRRRFFPTLDVLAARIAPSGGFDTCPMDPTLNPWEPPTLPADTSPMDPTLNPVALPAIDWESETEVSLNDFDDLDAPEPSSTLVVRYIDCLLSDATA